MLVGLLANVCATSITVGREPELGIRLCLAGLVGGLFSLRTVSGGVSGGDGGEIVVLMSARPGSACLLDLTLDRAGAKVLVKGEGWEGLRKGLTPIGA